MILPTAAPSGRNDNTRAADGSSTSQSAARSVGDLVATVGRLEAEVVGLQKRFMARAEEQGSLGAISRHPEAISNVRGITTRVKWEKFAVTSQQRSGGSLVPRRCVFIRLILTYLFKVFPLGNSVSVLEEVLLVVAIFDGQSLSGRIDKSSRRSIIKCHPRIHEFFRTRLLVSESG